MGEKKGFWIGLITVLGAIAAIVAMLLGGRRPPLAQNFVAKDDTTVITNKGEEVKVPEGKTSRDVVAAGTQEAKTISDSQVTITIATPKITPVPVTETKSVGELLFDTPKPVAPVSETTQIEAPKEEPSVGDLLFGERK